MEIKQGNKKFYIGEEKDPIGFIGYFDYGEGMIAIGHTFVKEEYRGQKIARLLLNKVVELARKENLKIAPLCSYALNVFNKDESYNDVYYRGESK
ncbi:TPA: N-acetyltransferase [bacterium]|jgi:predicted GNAT family acetyltransferase|nr:N-acetyltransferase [bacterium]